MEQDFGYYAVIPILILQDSRLKANAKLLYGQISALASKEGYCWAGDEKLSKDVGISKGSVKGLLKNLENIGYISRETHNVGGGKLRKIYIHKGANNATQGVKWTVDKGSNAPFLPLDKSLDKRIEIQSIKDAYAYRINKNSRLTEGAKTKIKARLKTYTLEELTKAIEKFSQDEWWMEKNSHQGLEWFFRSDAQIDKFLNLKTVKKTEMKYV